MTKPFKGSVAYEWQIGPFVFQWAFKTIRRGPHVWIDRMWRA